ncbi:SBBP repeat-containing protein [Hymenobacter tibetensis]|uniref:SBBP repeat-containing protein n=1 Tax=Hymenobacter tibetensis TaxID=497967 RepID=A0ABY4CVJ6_9BACT|nr:SBBP repeat-containing protein [Hymenobacter tibetensis]UOG73185.1 SBBP repeat-containing protein [Hymenobacter tibetensis]
MKHSFTRLLLAAAGLLVQVPTAQAQLSSAASDVQTRRPLPVLPHAPARPSGIPALHPSLLTAKAAAAATKGGRLPQRPQMGELPQLGASVRRTQESTLNFETVTETGFFEYQGPGSRSDRATGLTVDAAGNFYVVGIGLRAGDSRNDFITLKYSPSGQLLWTARYNTAPNSDTGGATDVAVDAMGNVYVTGPTRATSSASDYATIKYSASGQQLWVAVYNGPGNSTDVPSKVVVDGLGDVYVAGTTTVKYSPSGQQLWTATGGDIALDAANNVYLTGNGVSKYTASGQLIWATPGPGGAVDLDAAGNAYVTGSVDSGNNNLDYVARKYNGATGQRVWEARYNSSGNGRDEMVDAAVDAAGNVYITGTTTNGNSSGTRYATVKFSTAGQQLWEAIYLSVYPDSPAPAGVFFDVARRLVLDATGNVYVSGDSQPLLSIPTDYLTVKYNGATGQQVWDIRYDRVTVRRNMDEVADLAVDATGNVYVTGTTSFSGVFTRSFSTVKYTQSELRQLWEARFTGPGTSTEGAEDVVTDTSGNVYVTGYAYNGRNYDYATVKYTPTGQQLWEARYNGPADGEDLPTNVVVDSAGNVYVSGTSHGLAKSDYATIKYSPTGQQIWQAHYSGPVNGYNLATKVEVGRRGTVYVTGSSDNGSTTSYDYATVKYNAATGQQLWQATYNGPTNSFDLAADLVVDEVGDVYVTGTTYSSSSSDCATVKYASTSGQPVWESIYNGPNNGYDEATKLVLIGSPSRVVVAGTSEGESTGSDFTTVLYETFGGSQAWANQYNDPANGDDILADLAVTSQGDIVVAGTSYGGSSADYSTVRYNREGQRIWASRYDGPANSYDEATALALDAAGNSYVTGLSYNTDGTSDFATVRYAPGPSPNTTTGRLQWVAHYNGSGNSYDEPAAITVDAANRVHVTGFSLGSSTGYDFATLTYGFVNLFAKPLASAPQAQASTPLAVGPVASKHVQGLSVYPNPAAGQASVSFRPVQDGAAQVLVYNQLGRQVASLYHGAVRKGQRYTLVLDGQQLAPGLYTCSVLVNDQRETVRLQINH